MTAADGTDTLRLERRVLVLAPTARDAALAQDILQKAGLECLRCGDLAQICTEAQTAAAALLLPEEALAEGSSSDLTRLIAQQPSWSDLPVLILTARGADSAEVGRAVATLGNVTLLERPIRVAALVSAIRSALRARERQYQLRERLADQESTNAALRESDRRKNEFLAVLAHELRNPLATIHSSLHLIREASEDVEAVSKLRSRVERQVEIIVRLVDDLIEVSRITRGKIELRRELLDLSAVLALAIESSRLAIEEAGHKLILEVPGEPLPVEADPMRLAQVFANLLNNAARYTDRGGNIRIAAGRRGDQATVSVRDDGVGIEPDMLSRVFDMFTQADQTRERASGGLGIGLTLVRNLVELHGGSVEARSEGPGLGSEFIVRLPLAASFVAASAPATRQGVETAGRCADLSALRVLLVDDNRDAADSLAMLLRMAGAQVQVAHDGPSALDALGPHRPHVALLDIGMPGMNGYELATQIRKRPEGRRTTLVALTGWGQEDDRRRSRAAGFEHHLVKPVAPRLLQDLLASLQPREQ
jgi:signal transduction histidine kinase